MLHATHDNGIDPWHRARPPLLLLLLRRGVEKQLSLSSGDCVSASCHAHALSLCTFVS